MSRCGFEDTTKVSRTECHLEHHHCILTLQYPFIAVAFYPLQLLHSNPALSLMHHHCCIALVHSPLVQHLFSPLLLHNWLNTSMHALSSLITSAHCSTPALMHCQVCTSLTELIILAQCTGAMSRQHITSAHSGSAPTFCTVKSARHLQISSHLPLISYVTSLLHTDPAA